MKRGFVLLAGLLALWCSPAWGATGAGPKDFRGITWGGPVTSSLVKTSDAGDTVDVYRNKSKEMTPFLGVPVSDEAYYFTKGKLVGGQLFCRGEANFTKLKDALIKLYGPPENPKTGFYSWQWPDTQALVTIAYDRQSQYTTISMTSTSTGPPPAKAPKKKGR